MQELVAGEQHKLNRERERETERKGWYRRTCVRRNAKRLSPQNRRSDLKGTTNNDQSATVKDAESETSLQKRGLAYTTKRQRRTT
jgi:hypothetical protein